VDYVQKQESNLGMYHLRFVNANTRIIEQSTQQIPYAKQGQANKSFQANWQARFLIDRFKPAKALLNGVTSLPLPIA
jgi:hypothetical protein